MAAVTGCVAFGVEVACGCLGTGGSAEAVVAGAATGTLAALSVLAAPLAWVPGLNVAAYTPAAAMAERAISPIVAVIRPARKLISSSRA